MVPPTAAAPGVVRLAAGAAAYAASSRCRTRLTLPMPSMRAARLPSAAAPLRACLQHMHTCPLPYHQAARRLVACCSHTACAALRSERRCFAPSRAKRACGTHLQRARLKRRGAARSASYLLSTTCPRALFLHYLPRLPCAYRLSPLKQRIAAYLFATSLSG